MDFQDIRDVQGAENYAYQNDWLEIKMAQQDEAENKEEKKSVFSMVGQKMKQVFSKKPKETHKRQREGKNGFAQKLFSKIFKPVACFVIVAVIFAGIAIADNGFASEVFGFAKESFTSAIATGYNSQNTSKNMAVMPSNATISVSNGDVTLSGGSIAVNFLQGTVTDVTETSVTVSADNGVDIVYSNLKQTLVSENDIIGPYHAVGKYDETAVVNIVKDGEKLVNVNAEGYTLTW